MTQQSVLKRFIKNSFLLAAGNGRDRRSCAHLLAAFEHPGTEWALQPTRTALIKASGFEVRAGHDCCGLSFSERVLLELISRESRLKAAMRPLFQYSKTSESFWHGLFQKSLADGTTLSLLSSGAEHLVAD